LPADKGSEVVGACLKNGLLVNSPQPATIRLMPPLIVTAEDTDAMIAILSSVLADILA
jgi:acetylornithine/N-succinyldiaminopimelate aminotransferase